MSASGLPTTNTPQLPPPPPAPFLGINQVYLDKSCRIIFDPRLIFLLYAHHNITIQWLSLQGLQGFLNVRNNLGSNSLSPSTSHINGLPHQRPPMLSGSRPPSGIPQGLPPPHFPSHHQRPPPSSNPPVGLLANSSQMQVIFSIGIKKIETIRN